MSERKAADAAAPQCAGVEVLTRETVYSGFFRIDRYRLRHTLFAGGWSQPMMREVFERGHAVAVILYDPERDRLVLLEQFRVGALAAREAAHVGEHIQPWMLEVVAGIIDVEGESPEDVAIREALEEAGCTVQSLHPIQLVVASPGGSSETIMLYLGLTTAPPAGGIHGLDAEHEDIRVLIEEPATVFSWIDDGRITNATALIAMMWFRLHHQEIRAGWRPGPWAP